MCRGASQGCSKVRPIEGRSCSAALKSEDRRPKPERRPKSEFREWPDSIGCCSAGVAIRNPKPEGRKKPENRNPKGGPRISTFFRFRLWALDFGLWALDFGLWALDFGLWTSCGLRVSGLEWPGPTLEQSWVHPDTSTKAGGYAKRNAGFIRCSGGGARMRPCVGGHISILAHPVQISLTPRFSGVLMRGLLSSELSRLCNTLKE